MNHTSAAIPKDGEPAQMRPGNVLVLCAHYRNSAETSDFARACISLGYRIAIADNSGDAPSFTDLERETVTVCKSGGNLGYLNGCMSAARAFRRKHGGLPEWCCVTNTDINLPPDIVSGLPAHVPPVIACLSPAISNLTGAQQNPFLSKPPFLPYIFLVLILGLNRHVWRICHIFRVVKRLRRRDCTGRAGSAAPRFIFAGHGSLFFIRSKVLEEMLDRGFPGFMYNEELFVGRWLRKRHLHWIYWPSVRIVHREGAATGLINVERKSRWALRSLRGVLDRSLPQSGFGAVVLRKSPGQGSCHQAGIAGGVKW